MESIETIGTIVLIVLIIYIYKQYKKNKVLQQDIKELNSLVKSQQVKYGKSFEHFVPFINDFPANRENCTFMGMPLDFIAFEEDEIKFIEVKTGSSQLSTKQKHIKKLVEEKKVSFHELRF
jgi:predicted Holliday junction resolvase-like endonuclease